MEAALADGDWELIVCDYVMPGFGGQQALMVAQICSPHLPAIMVIGQAAEDISTHMTAAGADGYVHKEDLKHLGEAVRHHLAPAGGGRSERDENDGPTCVR
jgi:CheY-like chemotaxis protein